MILSDLFEALEDQRAYPYAKIRRDHVHQTEASDDFEAMDIQLRKVNLQFIIVFREFSPVVFTLFQISNTYSRIHKDEVHLHESEDHLQHRINAL